MLDDTEDDDVLTAHDTDVENVVVIQHPEYTEDSIPALPSPAAQIAFQDYMDLGPSRSVAALRNHYLAKRQKDPTSPIPTTDAYLLSQWEMRYNWRALAWEHDADSNRAFLENRKSILGSLYTSHSKRAEKILRIAEKAMDIIESDIDAGSSSLSPQDALKFMQEGTKAARECQEALLRLQDPSEQKAESGGGDFFDTIRKMGLLQINQNNYYGGSS